ncbi:MAG: porin family protein [Planctomycetes bacterium]|nr:porin family protein [Planctomycetota bacterium]
MRTPFLLFATALLGSSAWAQDDESPYYLQFSLGGVFSEDAQDVPGGTIGFDPGFSTGVALGRSFELNESFDYDIEFETYYQAFTVDEDDIVAIASAADDDAKALAFMVNGLLDWKFTRQYSVYGGLGLGWAKTIKYSAWDSGSLRITDNSGAAIQGRLGLAYNLGENYDARIGYRYFKTEPIDIEDTTAGTTDELDIAQHSLELQFRWSL